MKQSELGKLLETLFPINRSITGVGNRLTLEIIRDTVLPNLEILEVPSGTTAFDWIVPDEWNVSEAYIVTPTGEKLCDFKKNNLHLMGYSMPFQGVVSLEVLEKHLFSKPEMPDASPWWLWH